MHLREYKKWSNDAAIEVKRSHNSTSSREDPSDKEELQRLVYAISHDLRAPLREVLGFSDLLTTALNGKLEEREARFLEHIVSGAERLRKMLEGVLDYSRVQTRQAPFKPIFLEDVVNAAVLKLGNVAGLETIRLVTRRLPMVQGDFRQLVWIFGELLENASKYNPGGCVVEVEAKHDGVDFWEIRVSDNGAGLSEQQHERAFRLFQRPLTDSSVEGVGTGLAVVKRIVRRHGGEIGIESNADQGLTVWFTLREATMGELGN